MGKRGKKRSNFYSNICYQTNIVHFNFVQCFSFAFHEILCFVVVAVAVAAVLCMENIAATIFLFSFGVCLQ